MLESTKRLKILKYSVKEFLVNLSNNNVEVKKEVEVV